MLPFQYRDRKGSGDFSLLMEVTVSVIFGMIDAPAPDSRLPRSVPIYDSSQAP